MSRFTNSIASVIIETDWTFGRNGVAEKAGGDGSEVIVSEALKSGERRERGQGLKT